MKRLAAIVLLAALTTSPAWAASDTKFQLGGQTYKTSISSRYCLPSGPTLTTAHLFADADAANEVGLFYFPCKAFDPNPGADKDVFIVIRSPKGPAGVAKDRSAYLAYLKGQFASIDSADVQIQSLTGLDAPRSDNLVLRRSPDWAVALLGVKDFNVGREIKKMVFVSIISVMKGRVVSWTRYEPYSATNLTSIMAAEALLTMKLFLVENDD